MDKKTKYFLGLDLGQAKDFTALCILERHGEGAQAEYHARHLQRYVLGTKYPAIVEDVLTLLTRPPLKTGATLALDQTMVGAPVIDLFTAARGRLWRMKPVHITAGSQESEEKGVYYVPKRLLVGLVQAALQTDRLKVAEKLPEAATLVHELQNFQIKISEGDQDTTDAWREGAHDDLVLAVALALWAGQQKGIGVYI